MDVAHPMAPATEAPAALKFPTGAIVAALLAAWIGLMTLAITNIAADVDNGFKNAITLNAGIGPYSGKELFMFVGWFVSWPVLHFALRKRDLKVKKWFAAFLAGVLVAVLLMWPPIFGAIAAAIKGG